MSYQPPSVAVVGAGIAGLTAAWRLQQRGVAVRVFEREAQAGGRMRTIDHEGFRVEAGATILSRSCTGMRQLIAELGIGAEFGPASTHCAFRRNERMHHVHAERKLALLRTSLFGLPTKLALLRAFATFLAQSRHMGWKTMDGNVSLDSLSASQFARKRLTQEAFDYLCEPLFGGGLALASPDDLNAADMFFAAGKLLRPHFNSPRGVGLVTDTLARRVGPCLGAQVTQVRAAGHGVDVIWQDGGGRERTERFDSAVVALPAPQAPALLPELLDEDRRYLSSVPYSRGLIVSLGLARRPDEPASVVFLPRREHPDLATIELHHNKLPGRVDNGRALLTLQPRTAFTDRWWDADDATVIERGVEAAAAVFPDIPATLLTGHVARRDPALVVRPPGGYAELRSFKARRAQADPRIQLAGDYLGASGTNGALLSGEDAARRILAHVGQRNGA